MSIILTITAWVLFATAIGIGLFLGWDKLPLTVLAAGFAIAGGMSLHGAAVVEAARLRGGSRSED
jgi:hypothetical protein